MIAVHYSRSSRTCLDSAMWGTGKPDAATLRVCDDRILRHRIYLYADRGLGIVPEPGVGHVAHTIDTDDVGPIYCTRTDPDGLIASAKGYNASERVSTWERAIYLRGYAGYRAPFGRCDAVVLIGPRLVPVTADG